MKNARPIRIILDNQDRNLSVTHPSDHPDDGKELFLELREPGMRGQVLFQSRVYVMRALVEEGEELYGGKLPNPQALMIDAALHFLEWVEAHLDDVSPPDKLRLNPEDVERFRQAAPDWPVLRKQVIDLFVGLDSNHPNVTLDAWGLAVMLGTTHHDAQGVAQSLVRANVLTEDEWHFQLHPAEARRLELSAETAPPDAPARLPSIPPDFSALTSDPRYALLFTSRWQEAEAMTAAGAWRFTVIALGSLLEGALIARYQRDGIKIPGTLNDMIKGAQQHGWFQPARIWGSHVLREYRNYIHPEREFQEPEVIDEGTCNIVWSIIRSAINDLVKS